MLMTGVQAAPAPEAGVFLDPSQIGGLFGEHADKPLCDQLKVFVKDTDWLVSGFLTLSQPPGFSFCLILPSIPAKPARFSC